MSEKNFFKSVNIWLSYKQGRDCLMHFARLANTLLKDEEMVKKVGHESVAPLFGPSCIYPPDNPANSKVSDVDWPPRSF